MASKRQLSGFLTRVATVLEDASMGSALAQQARALAGDLEPEDPRIRMQLGRLRVVAPNGKGDYINGRLVIEERDTDSLGAPVWRSVCILDWPSPSDSSDEARGARAIYKLLAGDAADKELR